MEDPFLLVGDTVFSMNRLLYALYLASRWLATGSAYTRIAIAFDARKVDVTRIRDITVALATVASNPISVTPLVPTFGANTATTNLSDQIYFLLYPFPLPGDVLPTVQVTATYLAPFPGEPWQPRTVYPPGAIVTPATPDGHYYETVDGGVSQLTEPGTWTHFS
jgi:hypothetical protein